MKREGNKREYPEGIPEGHKTKTLYGHEFANNKRGQITIFIIIGLVIFTALILLFLLRGKQLPDFGGKTEINPVSFFDSCMEEKIEQTVKTLSIHGGYIKNPFNYTFKFENEPFAQDISFLCYNRNYYLSCINQEPMLIEHIKKEIYNELSDQIGSCLTELKENIKKRNFEIKEKFNDFEVQLMPKKIVILLDNELTLTKGEETTTQEDFKIIFPTRLYDLAIVAQEIVSQEARFCNFEQVGYMLINQENIIDKFRTGDSTTIYYIENKENKENFRFAVRGCVIPPGF